MIVRRQLDGLLVVGDRRPGLSTLLVEDREIEVGQREIILLLDRLSVKSVIASPARPCSTRTSPSLLWINAGVSVVSTASSRALAD